MYPVYSSAISATSAAIINAIDYKTSDKKVTYNSPERVLTGTIASAVVGAIPGSDKTLKIMKPQSNSKAVKTARVTAHAEGKSFQAKSAKGVANKNTARNKMVKEVNQTVTDLVDAHKESLFTDTGHNTLWNYIERIEKEKELR